MGALQTNRITLPELQPGEPHFRRIHDDLQRRGEGLANADEADPAVVRGRLAGIVGRLIKEEIQNDPAGMGYAAVGNAEKLRRLLEAMPTTYGAAAGYAVVSTTPETRSNRVAVTAIGGGAANLLAANIPPGVIFRIGVKRYSVMAVPNNTDVIINMDAVLPVAAQIGVFESADVQTPRINTILLGIPHAPNGLSAADFLDAMA